MLRGHSFSLHDQVSYVYLLFEDELPFVATGGNPPVPDPTPSNNDATSVTISGLTFGRLYAIEVWSVSQAGVQSTTATTYQWQVRAAVPGCVVCACDPT